MTRRTEPQASFEAPRRHRPVTVGVALALMLGVALVVAFRGGEAGNVVEGELMAADTGATTSPRTGALSPDAGAAPGARQAMSGPGADGDVPPAGELGGFEADLPDSVRDLLAQARQRQDRGDETAAVELLKQAAVDLRVRSDQATADGDVALAEMFELALGELQAQVSVLGGDSAAAEVATLENRIPHAPPSAGEVRRMGIMELGNFPYDPDKGGLPADVLALDGMPIILSGYMMPGYQTDRLREFTLVQDVYECCFGQPPGLEHTIQVNLPAGRSVSYYYGEVEVTGVLSVRERLEEGYVVNLFTIEDVSSVRATGR